MQIVQFIIDLFAVYFGSELLPSFTTGLAGVTFSNPRPRLAYSYFVSTYWLGKFPSMGSCAGTESAALFGCGLLTSYLGLFINFYIQTYKKPSRGGKKPVANGNGIANGNGNGVAQ